MSLYAVLLDTMSIQKYVFSTNRLKENLGASYLVQNIYEGVLKKVLKGLFPDMDDNYLSHWKDKSQAMPSLEEGRPFEIGYIGGGNALLFFKEKEGAESFLKKWTARLLVDAPGIIPAAATGECNIKNADDNTLENFIKNLFKTLAENKNRYIPQTVIPRHGITAECTHTGYSMEIWCERLPKDDQNYISSVSNAKIEAAEKAKKKHIEILEKCNLSDRYTFTDELDKLGQKKEEESHIAIVYIDGNDMGKRFRDQKTLRDLRELSKTVAEATLNAFKAVLLEIDRNFDRIKNEFHIHKEDGKLVLPVRPIIIGGDDITFVTDGRLGIWLAKVFLERFEKQNVSDGKPLSACAGVAITKTKYPFYRGYELSEELCYESAKKERKNQKDKDNGSWLDWHLVYGGIMGELKDIRERQYKGPTGTLYMRPYKTEDLTELIKAASEFKEEKDGKLEFPRSKLMDLREVIFKDESSQEAFLKELKARGLELPVYNKEFNGKKIVVNSKTPYLDMIELLELYPEFVIKGGA
ncbi:hypothetical protein JZK55_15120 [Dissulfurispira thermophila]|uniref:Cas10/Cmr2 second palm domain-containing protein n=1 Tax=Dissulfurispira thermophila TaxID=2715679 RepID=A0A7G1H197_9BACT|nr:hypothetical protein [Dissulfurispira thermophila]BCB96590.1 hypothetical protein JZK55_15120 [Dissulfurispira thermophila]